MSDAVSDAWKKYMLQLQLHPLRTKAITAGVLVGFSDFAAQKISGVKRLQFRRLFLMMEQSLDRLVDNSLKQDRIRLNVLSGILTRSSRKLVYGFCYSGPVGHFFHKLMDKIFKGKKGTKTVGQKVVLEQISISPFNNLFFMMYYGLVVEGRSWSMVKSKVKKDYPSVQLTSWKFWPIINCINYQYMPLQLRVLFHNIIASFWAIFLNLKARSVANTIKKA